MDTVGSVGGVFDRDALRLMVQGSTSGFNVRLIPIDLIDPSPHQVRSVFDVADLVESIKKRGLLQPLGVVKRGDRYELVFGERRLRAAREAGLRQVPCVVFSGVDDAAAAELGFIENIARKNITQGERCLMVARLLELGYTPEEVAQTSGVTPAYVVEAAKVGRWLEEVVRIHGQEKAAVLLGRDMSMTALLRLARTVPPEEALEALQKGLPGEGRVGTRPYRIRLSRLQSTLEELVAKVRSLKEYRFKPKDREGLLELVQRARELVELLEEMVR